MNTDKNITEESMKQQNKRDNKRLIIAAIASAAIITGAAFAWFTSSETVTNTFTVGEIKIDVLEPKFKTEDVTDLMPTQETAKDPKIANTGKNKAVVFLKVDVPLDSDEKEIFEMYKTGNATKITGDNGNWILLTDYPKTVTSVNSEKTLSTDITKYKEYIYGYKKVLNPDNKSGHSDAKDVTDAAEGSVTDNLFDKVKVFAGLSQSYAGKQAEVVVTGYGIQSTNIVTDESADLTKDQLTTIFNETANFDELTAVTDASTANAYSVP